MYEALADDVNPVLQCLVWFCTRIPLGLECLDALEEIGKAKETDLVEGLTSLVYDVFGAKVINELEVRNYVFVPEFMSFCDDCGVSFSVVVGISLF